MKFTLSLSRILMFSVVGIGLASFESEAQDIDPSGMTTQQNGSSEERIDCECVCKSGQETITTGEDTYFGYMTSEDCSEIIGHFLDRQSSEITEDEDLGLNGLIEGFLRRRGETGILLNDDAADEGGDDEGVPCSGFTDDQEDDFVEGMNSSSTIKEVPVTYGKWECTASSDDSPSKPTRPFPLREGGFGQTDGEIWIDLEWGREIKSNW